MQPFSGEELYQFFHRFFFLLPPQVRVDSHGDLYVRVAKKTLRGVNIHTSLKSQICNTKTRKNEKILEICEISVDTAHEIM